MTFVAIDIPNERPALHRGNLTYLLSTLIILRRIFPIVPFKTMVHPPLPLKRNLRKVASFLIRLTENMAQFLLRSRPMVLCALPKHRYVMELLVLSVAPRTLVEGGAVAIL